METEWKHLETFGNQTINPKNLFYCEECDFKCFKQYNFNRHLMTRKHIKKSKKEQKGAKKSKKEQEEYIHENQPIYDNEKMFICEKCKKGYKNRSGLWKHKNICEKEKKQTQVEVETYKETNNKKNDELMEYIKNILEYVKNNENNKTINNTFINNKTFNLNFFLNDVCKNALNIDEFFNSIHISIRDLENAEGNIGYVKNISGQILKYYKSLNIEKRPFHCIDEKRKKLYVKVNSSWTNENTEEIMTPHIKNMSMKNFKLINEWKKNNPGFNECDNANNTKYLNIIDNIVAGSGDDEFKNNINKINDILIKESVISKQKFLR